MGQKTSHSQNNTYIACPQHWNLSYNEGWANPIEGSSTYFGSAVDAAVSDMLEGGKDYIKTFYDRWNKSWSFGKSTQIFDNPDIVFGHKDFDKDILEPKDYPQLEAWAKSLNLMTPTATPTPQELVALYKTTANAKKNPFVKITNDQLVYFNRASWLSMKRKGKVLLEAFHTQFYPKITKVIATQQRATLKDEATGDSVTGFIDMVLEIQGYDKPIIFDLKTAGMPYDQENIDLTQQLTLYAAMKGNDYNTDLVGFVVLCKNIQKITTNTCQTCGNLRNGRHATCDALKADGTRCKGTWTEKVTPAPVVQVLIEQKTPQQVNDLLGDVGNLLLAMKQKIVYKNVDKCNNWYGGPCPFYNACHKGDYSGLVKKK